MFIFQIVVVVIALTQRQERLGLGHTKNNLMKICLISALLEEN